MSNIDNIDKMLQGEETPIAPQAETVQQDDSQRIEQQTDEEVEFNKLSGSTQDRIKELVRRAREAETRQQTPAYAPPAPNTLLPDQKQAIETLSQFGIATDEKVDKKVSEGLSQIKYELRNQSLESKYSGQNGEPQYSREEVEDFIQKHPQYTYYDPEDVFKFKMYPDEFASVGKQTAPRQRANNLRPTKAQQRQDALTPDYIEQRLRQPDGDEWYEANKEEINKVVYNHTQQFKDVNFSGQ